MEVVVVAAAAAAAAKVLCQYGGGLASRLAGLASPRYPGLVSLSPPYPECDMPIRGSCAHIFGKKSLFLHFPFIDQIIRFIILIKYRGGTNGWYVVGRMLQAG